MTYAQDLTALAQAQQILGSTIHDRKLGVVQGTLGSYREALLQLATAANNSTVNLDCQNNNVFELTLNHPTTKLSFTNLPLSDQTNKVLGNITLRIKRGVAGATIDWTGLTISWQDGVAPVQGTTINKYDTYVLIPTGATSFEGYVSGTNR